MASSRDPSETEALRQLILGEDLGLLRAVEQRMRALEGRVATREALAVSVQEALVDTLKRAGVVEHERVAAALAPFIVQSMRDEIRNSRAMMVDALHPIVGRLVAASVANALRDLLEAIDKRLDQTFSPERWRARALSVFTGRSTAEILLARNPPFSVEGFVLVHRQTGLPIVDGPAERQDTELVAGMVSALLGFAQQAMRAGVIDTIRFADGALHLTTSPALALAVHTRGPTPPDLDRRLEAIFSAVSERWGLQLADFEGSIDDLPAGEIGDDLALRVARLETDGTATARKKLPVAATVLVGLALAAGLAFGGWRLWEGRQEAGIEDRVQAVIDGMPALAGYPVTVTLDAEAQRLSVVGLAPDEATRADLLAAVASELPPGTALTADRLAAVARDVTVPAARPAVDPALSRQIAALSSALDDLLGRVDDVAGRVGAVATRLDETDAGIARDRADLDRRLTRLDDAVEARLAAQRETVLAPISALRADTLELTRRFADLRGDLDRATTDIGSAEADMQVLANRIDEALAGLDRAVAAVAARDTDRASETDSRIDGLSERIGGIDDGLAAARDALDRVDGQIAAANEDIAAANAAIAAASIAIGDGRAADAALATRLDETGTAIGNARGDVWALTERLDRADSAIADGLAMDEALAARLDETNIALTLARAELAIRLDETDAAMSVDRAELQARLDRTDAAIAAARTAIASLDARAQARTADAVALGRAELAAAIDGLGLEGARATVDDTLTRHARALAALDEALERQAAAIDNGRAARDALAADMRRIGAAADAAGANARQAVEAAGASAGPAEAVGARIDELEVITAEALALVDRRLHEVAKATGDELAARMELEAELAKVRAAVGARLDAMASSGVGPLASAMHGLTVRFSESDTLVNPDRAEQVATEVASLLLQADENIGVRVVGYADRRGGDREANLETTRKRANLVHDMLVQRGVPERRLVAIGRGAERMVSEDERDGNPNRRVEFEPILLSPPLSTAPQ